MRSAKGDAAVDYIQPIEASGNEKVIDLDAIEEPKISAKKRKFPNDDDASQKVYSKKHVSESWKEKYFQSMSNNDERICEAKLRKIELESYNLLLQNIGLEKSLGLQDHEIIALRSTISPNLASVPSYLTQFLLEEEPFVTVEAQTSTENE